jgi:hypothetical protein
MKRFLIPKKLRCGSPTLIFVSKEGNKYWLGTYHELNESTSKRAFSGMGTDYNATHRIKISKELYQALIKESKANSEIMTNEYNLR